MKAKVKATGEQLNVEKVCDFNNGTFYYIVSDIDDDDRSWEPQELELFPDETMVIEGWVAVDERGFGGPFLHAQKPHSDLVEFCDTGDYEVEWNSDGEIYQLDKKFFPDMTPEDEPKKVRITLTTIG